MRACWAQLKRYKNAHHIGAGVNTCARFHHDSENVFERGAILVGVYSSSVTGPQQVPPDVATHLNRGFNACCLVNISKTVAGSMTARNAQKLRYRSQYQRRCYTWA